MRTRVVFLALALLGGLVPAAPLLTATVALAASTEPAYCAETAVNSADVAAGKSPRLDAVFIRPDVGPATATGSWWSGPEWDRAMESLREVCIHQVVLQWTAKTWAGAPKPPGYSRPDIDWKPISDADPRPRCIERDPGNGLYVQPLYASGWYPAWNANRAQSTELNPPTCDAIPNRVDQVTEALRAAASRGIKVWLGLQIDEGAWFSSARDDTAWMDVQAQLSKDLVQELWDRYGPTASVANYSTTIAGFYLPFETDNNGGFKPGQPSQTSYRDHYLKPVTAYIQDKAGSKPTMVSPIMRTQIGADPNSQGQIDHRADWSSTVTDWVNNSRLAVIAPQDAVGQEYATAVEVGPWAKATYDGIRAAGSGTGRNLAGRVVALSYDCEAFDQRTSGTYNLPVGQLLTDIEHTMDGGAVIAGWVAFSHANFDTDTNTSSIGYHPNARVNQIFHWAYYQYLSTGGADLPIQRIPAPSGLTGGSVAGHGTTVNLGWQPILNGEVEGAPSGATPRPVTSYRVYRNGVQIGAVRQAFSATGNDQYGNPAAESGEVGFLDRNLQPGRKYSYQIAAQDPFGNTSPLSTAITISIPLDAAGAAAAANPALTMVGPDLAVGSSYQVTDNTYDATTTTTGYYDDKRIEPSSSYPDTRQTNTLTDGVLGAANYWDPAWEAQESTAAPYTIEIDLGAPTDVAMVRSHWLNVADEPHPPVAVAVEYAATAGGAWQTDFGYPADQPTPATGAPPANPNPAFSTSATQPATGGVVFADPGANWMTSSLDPGETVRAQRIRLIVSPPAGKDTYLSEIEVRGPDGSVNLAAGRAATLSNAENLAWHPQFHNSELTDGIGPATVNSGGSPTYDFQDEAFLGWYAKADQASRPHAGQVLRFTVDLGQNQPIRALTADWLYDPQHGIYLPEQVQYAYYTEPGPGGSTPGWVNAGTALRNSTLVPNGLQSYPRWVSGGTSTQPVLARWIRFDVTLNYAEGWAFASGLHVYAPAVLTPTKDQPVHLYRGPRNLDDDFDPDQPIDATNNPTDPALSVVWKSGATQITTCAPNATPCRTTGEAGLNTLTHIDQSTGRPYVGNPQWGAANSNWVGLASSGNDGYNLVIPVTDGPSSLAQFAQTFLENHGGGLYFPESVDFYVTTTPNPTADPASNNWVWTGDTLTRPNLPSYLPDATSFTWHYVSAIPVTAGGPITAIGIHLNPHESNQTWTDHLGGYLWAAN